MPVGCLRHTSLPSTSSLFGDFVYNFDRVAAFYQHNPWVWGSYRDAAAALAYPDSRRRAVVEALRRQNPDNASLDKLAQPGTVAVVTGQQVGLYSGPCYTIYKALTAARVAERLNSDGVPAVPVFWLATEDHDFEEVNHAWAFDATQAPQALRVAAPEAGARPVGNIALHHPPNPALRSALADLPFGSQVASWVEESYANGQTMGQAFKSLLRRLVPDLDLVFIDPLDAGIRTIAAELMEQAAALAPRLRERLLDRNRELESAGYHAQVHVDAKTSLFFRLEDGVRRKLNRAVTSVPASQLSPNALLRPLVQDFLLPTAAMIAGPAELAYLAQAQVLYQELKRPMPVLLPRSGFTLLDARAEKLMTRYGLSLPDLFDDPEAVREKIAARLAPPGLVQSIANARANTTATLDQLESSIASFDATLGAALRKSRLKILHQLGKIQAKTQREALRRDHRAQGDAAYLIHLIYPEKHLQERIYTILPFVARHGPELIGRLYESVRLDCPDHIVLVV